MHNCFFRVVFLKLSYASKSSGCLVKMQVAGPNSEFMIQLVQDGAEEFVFLTSSKVILMQLD